MGGMGEGGPTGKSICIHTADSPHQIGETNTTMQSNWLNPNLRKNSERMRVCHRRLNIDSNESIRCTFSFFKRTIGTSLGSQWLRLEFPMQAAGFDLQGTWFRMAQVRFLMLQLKILSIPLNRLIPHFPQFPYSWILPTLLTTTSFLFTTFLLNV